MGRGVTFDLGGTGRGVAQVLVSGVRADLLGGSYLQADETPIRYWDPEVKDKSRQGWLWTYSRPDGDVLFQWRTGRSREGPREFLEKFRGKLQTDGYAVYEPLARERSDLI